MPEGTEKIAIHRVTREGKQAAEDLVVTELPLTIMLNGQELVTLLCSAVDLKHLAIGFLASEGLLKTRDDIKRVTVDQRKSVVRIETIAAGIEEPEAIFKRIITPGCGRGASFYSAADSGLEKATSELSVTAGAIFDLMKTFQHHSEVFLTTGGVHSAALCNEKDVVIFSEDIGRHNAIDRIFGRCFMEDIDTTDGIIVTSGRVSSEIVVKIARRRVPMLVSKSAPTSTAVKMAGDLGITLAGFVRGNRMNVYTHDWRIQPDAGRANP